MLTKTNLTKMLILLSLIWYTAGCSCPESETLESINELIIPEYVKYLNEDPFYKKPENKGALRIRLIHVETIQGVIDARKE